MTLRDIATDDLLAELRRRRQEIDEAIHQHASPDFARVIAVVTRLWDVAEGAIFTATRKVRVTMPRQAAMCLLREVLEWTYQDIADQFRLDVGTAMHAMRTQEGRMTDVRYAARYEQARMNLKKPAQ